MTWAEFEIDPAAWGDALGRRTARDLRVIPEKMNQTPGVTPGAGVQPLETANLLQLREKVSNLPTNYHRAVTRDVADPGDLQGFDAGAARAIALAESEAGQLGHERVGTEHLLLGVLTNDSDASTILADAGVTLAATRNKVGEAVGNSSRSNPGRRPRPLPKTPRATRALGRARRFAHARGSDAVTSRHVLLGVLDVEGIAGQVLRGLGLDVESLRVSLDALDAPSPSDQGTESRRRDPASLGPTTCPACNSSLDVDLVYRAVSARDADGHTRAALIFACGVCGWFLGTGPA